ncbi:MAG: GNAT family N-acetyltransferase [Candidatus Pacearchaeota archaeon]
MKNNLINTENVGLKIITLSKEYAIKNTEEILKLEKNWVEIGDEPWTIDNLMYELPMKWKLSHVALYNGKIVGYQIGSLKDNVIFLNKIITDKGYRGLGIGKKLLKEFMEKSLQEGIKRIHFRVRVDNPAVMFYNKLGFKPNEKLDYQRKDGIASYYYDNEIEKVIGNLTDN